MGYGGFGAGGTGAVVAVSFAAAGLCAIPLGVVSDRIGARRGMPIGVAVSAIGAGTIGLLAGSFGQLRNRHGCRRVGRGPHRHRLEHCSPTSSVRNAKAWLSVSRKRAFPPRR